MPKKIISGKIIKSKYNKSPLWDLNNENISYLPNILKNDEFNNEKNKFENIIPTITNCYIRIPLHIDKKNTWLFYWVSDKIEEPHKIMYDNNYGLIKTDSDGKCNLEVNCPLNFKNKNLTYPKYINYTCLNKNTWDINIYTLTIVSYIKYKKFLRHVENKDSFIMYITNEKYIQDKINNSYDINYDNFINKNVDDKDEFLNKYLLKHLKYYPKLNELIKENKISIEYLPIIVYTDKKNSENIINFINILNSLNFKNVIYYYGGLQEWLQNKKIEKLEKNNIDDDESIIIEYEGINYKMFIDTSELINDDGIIIGIYNKNKNNVKWENEKYENNHNNNPNKITKNEIEEKYKEKIHVIKEDNPEFIENKNKKEESDSSSESDIEENDYLLDYIESSSDSESDSESESDSSTESDEESKESLSNKKNTNDNEDELINKENKYDLLSNLIKNNTKKENKKTFKKRKSNKYKFY